MKIYAFVYLGLIVLSLVLACWSYKKGYRPSLYLAILLSLTLLTELYVATSKARSFGWAYHLYNPFEYALLCVYFLKAGPDGRFKTLIQYSIPLYFVFSLTVSFLNGFRSIPAFNITVENILLLAIFSYLLFKLDPPGAGKVYAHPDFWVAVAFMIFSGGVVMLGLYPYLLTIGPQAARKLFGMVMAPLNIWLYMCLCIGSLCVVKGRWKFIS
ncbi:hypothetical protein [Hufsiella ginkgonis]|uniref:Uncharacterized protein n=1 Tax=Hufsiella ginkgonis TaxID=2695274 RepID=A0A7K1XTL4_9SPHI|nr:hypothetical protein [Hufsiella ginkgonis]MXV14280.1 hypothetical protein [Hufsiella ginkgonis]